MITGISLIADWLFCTKQLHQSPDTDQKAGLAPLFEVQLLLQIPEIVFYPSLEFSASDGFHDLVESLINSIFRISALVPRLSEHSGFQHYQVLSQKQHFIWI